MFDRWSGDASGSSSSIDILVDGNKNVTANFVLKKYELSVSIEGEGRVTETIVNTGKGTDYDSGTNVRLEAVPSTGYYFSGWSGDINGTTNPIDINIDRPKTISATFEKLSYELRVLKQGEGTVTEEIINTGKSTDYEYNTTVRLTATPEEGSDFIEWEESGATTDVNPFDIVVTEPKVITAVFEYDLFNVGVGKWKIRKPPQSQKALAYNVYSIIFNRNRSFRLNYSSGQISGTFSVTSNSNIRLNNFGSLSNVQINQGQISFNLNITGLFQFNVVGNKVQTYQQNRTHIPDQNFEQALIDGGYDTAIDTYIDDSSMLGVTQLDLSNRQITDFTGLEEFVNLTDLNLSGNKVTSVPLVNLNKLTTLNLSNTGLTELDLSQNNNVTSLNLSGNSALSCVKVSQQIYQQVPLGWIYEDCTLSCNSINSNNNLFNDTYTSLKTRYAGAQAQYAALGIPSTGLDAATAISLGLPGPIPPVDGLFFGNKTIYFNQFFDSANGPGGSEWSSFMEEEYGVYRDAKIITFGFSKQINQGDNYIEFFYDSVTDEFLMARFGYYQSSNNALNSCAQYYHFVQKRYYSNRTQIPNFTDNCQAEYIQCIEETFNAAVQYSDLITQ